MAIELNLTKTDNKTPWGFILVGGSEYNLPLTVVKVDKSGRAEEAGLQIGDVIVRVNETPTSGLTHVESHDIIGFAGNHLILAVRRGKNLYLVPRNSEEISDYEIDEPEVTNTLQSVAEQLENEQYESEVSHIVEKFEDKSAMTVHSRQESAQQNISHHTEEIVISSTSHNVYENSQMSCSSQGRKWSTFLQKPDHPVPVKPKEPEKPKGPEYKVVIKKQPKKRAKFYSEPVEDLQEEESISVRNSESRETSQEPNNKEFEENNEYHQEQQYEVYTEDYQPEKEDVDQEGKTLDENGNEIVEEDPEENVEQGPPTLEERLLQIQKQLEALTQLPTPLQETLAEVTKELAEIVGKNTEPDKSDSERHVRFEEPNVSDDENYNTGHLSDEEQIDEDSLEAEARDNENRKQYGHDEDTDDDVCEELASLDTEEPNVEEVEQGPTEEELEAMRIEKERLEKLEKEEAEKRQKPKLIQRPIILPGGRRWIEPDDACPKVRNPKMTDERICETIETYSEVNHLNKVWPWADEPKPIYRINFLKYQPPPKNLDYLQRSEVYRLVHDMEPPVKGISTRTGIILAEEDYYDQASSS